MRPPLENRLQALASDEIPRVLVADDDPASLLFLTETLHALGLSTLGCADGIETLAKARSERFALLVLDRHMPGGGGEQILVQLRTEGCYIPAVATSAELDEATRQHLYACGFDDLLLKPCRQHDLRRIAARVMPDWRMEFLLDDDQAMASSGDRQIMRALRGLMRVELMELDREWEQLIQDPTRLRERLHRLLASCGFCGATSLASQTQLLQQQLSHGRNGHPLWIGFRETLRATIDALQEDSASR